LGDEQHTHAAFVRLRAQNPELAAQCQKTVLPSILKAGDRNLANELVPEIHEEIIRSARDLQEIHDHVGERPGVLDVLVNGCATDIRVFEALLRLIGRDEDIARVRVEALSVITSSELKELLDRALSENR
jgi:hypothetical protein